VCVDETFSDEIDDVVVVAGLVSISSMPSLPSIVQNLAPLPVMTATRNSGSSAKSRQV